MLFARIDEKHEKFLTLCPLTEGKVERLRKEFMIDCTYSSNSIEGDTLALKEAAMVLEGMAIGQSRSKTILKPFSP